MWSWAVVEYEQVVCIPAVRDARVIVNIKIIVSPSVQGKIPVVISIATHFPCFCTHPKVFFYFRCSGMWSGISGTYSIFSAGLVIRAPGISWPAAYSITSVFRYTGFPYAVLLPG